VNILLINLVLAAIMTGLIWTVQVAQYPLFRFLDVASLSTIHRQHCARIGCLVGPLMLAELTAAIALVVTQSGATSWTLLGLLVLIWLSTVLLQAPAHAVIAQAEQIEDATAARFVGALVLSNWIRTILWTARAGILAMAVAKQLPG